MKTKEFYESIIKKVENAKSYDTLTRVELRASMSRLKKRDTRFVELSKKYGAPKCKTVDSPKIENPVKIVEGGVATVVAAITPKNYKTIMLPGITRSGGEKTKYSKIELEYLKALNAKEGITNAMIAELLKRSISSVENRITAVHKSERTFGTVDSNNRKYTENKKFFDSFGGAVTKIGDFYCGERMWWKNNCPGVSVISNDIDKEIKSDFNEPATYLLRELKKQGKSFDIIDLDTYTYTGMYEIETAIGLATMGLVLTFGDRRGLKNADAREDGESRVVTIKERYELENYDEDSIIEAIKNRALESYSKKLTVFSKYSTGRIWRVYFKIEEPSKAELICLFKKKMAEIERFRLKILEKIEEEKKYWERPVENILK